ncbi:MAG: Flp family type IVb pilin, partial [Asticcacaulis sp.]
LLDRSDVMLKRFIKDESGATAIEYGLIGALMFLACITAFFSFGDSAKAMFEYISTTVDVATDAATQ